LSAGTARHYLNALSNLYRRARAERLVPSGYDPVGDLLEKPTARREEAKWLEVPEAALLVEAARTHVPKRSDLAVPFAYPLIAAFLLTGGRRAEVLGLEVGDVSFDRKTVTFRPNDWRRLKTATSLRSVPLWPQLEEILRAYVFGAGKHPGRLLFPCYKTGGWRCSPTSASCSMLQVRARAGSPARSARRFSGTPTPPRACRPSTRGRR
jgi:integrase